MYVMFTINFPLTVSIRPDAPILAPFTWRKFIGLPIIDLSSPPGFLFGGSESKSHLEAYFILSALHTQVQNTLFTCIIVLSCAGCS